MINDSDYQTAKQALAHALQQPDALSAEDIDDLSSVVEEYHKQKKPVGAEHSMLSPEISGPTGGDMLEQQLGTPGPQTVTETPQDKLSMSALSPQAQKAVGDALQGMPPRHRSEEMDEAIRTNEESYSQLQRQLQAQHDAIYDDKLPSESKVKELYRDPEYMPPDMVKPQSATEAMLSPMQTMRALPSFVPHGGTDHYEEPSLEQFQRNMVPIYGEEAAKLTKNSEAYKQYADAEWAKTYDQAKAEGRPVVRTSHMNTEHWTGKVRQMAANAAGAAAGAAEGLSEGAYAGLAHRLGGEEVQRNLENAAENHPWARDTGRVIGAMSPASLGGLVARGAGKVLPGMSGWIGGALKSGGVGAVAAGTDTAANKAVRVGMDGEKLDLKDTLSDIGDNSLKGFGMGAGFDVIGKAAGLHGPALRKSTRLGEAEEIPGVQTSVTKGIEPGPKVDAMRAEAYGAQGSPSVYANEAEKLAGTPERPGPLSEAAHGEHVAEERRVGNIVREYYKLHQNTQKSVGPLLKSAMEAHEGFMDGDGKGLPWAGEKANKLRAPINDMVTTELVEGGWKGDEALRAARRKNPDAMLVPVAKAEAMGLDLAKATRGLSPAQRAELVAAKPESSLPFDPTLYGEPPTSYRPSDGTLGGAPTQYGADIKSQSARGSAAANEATSAERKYVADIKKKTGPNMDRFLKSGQSDFDKSMDQFLKSGQADFDKNMEQIIKSGQEAPTASERPAGANEATNANGAAAASRQRARGGAEREAERRTMAEIKEQIAKNRERAPESDEGDLNKYLPPEERHLWDTPSSEKGPHLLVVPRKYNPQRVDEIVQAIDDSLKVGRKGVEVSPDYARLLKASREVRDQFPAAPHLGVPDKKLTLPDGTEISGWSAFKHEVSEKMGESQNRLKLAGINGPIGPTLSADQYGAFVPKLADYGKSNSGAPGVARAQRELAGLSGHVAKNDLENIRRLHALESVEKGTKGQEGISMRSGALIPRAAFSAQGIRMRLDPILSTLALPGGASQRLGGASALKLVPQLRGGTPGGLGSVDSHRVTHRKSVTDEEARKLYDLYHQTQDLSGE